MENEEEDVVTQEEETTEEVQEEEEQEVEEEVDYKKKFTKERRRRMALEAKAKVPAKEEAVEAVKDSGDLSTKDAIALMANQVTEEEDIDYIVNTAKGFGYTIAQALKDSTIKAKLAERIEERTSAEMTSTTKTRRGSSAVSDDVLVKNAEKCDMPVSDSDIDRLIGARMGLNKK